MMLLDTRDHNDGLSFVELMWSIKAIQNLWPEVNGEFVTPSHRKKKYAELFLFYLLLEYELIHAEGSPIS